MMIITSRIIAILYILLCVIVAVSFIKTKNNVNAVVISEKEYYLKTFLSYFLLCILITPIIFGIYKLLKSREK